jgi:hypothetical protein
VRNILEEYGAHLSIARRDGKTVVGFILAGWNRPPVNLAAGE